MENKATWIDQPTKKQVFLISGIWAFGMICSLLAQTNFFTETPLQEKYFVINTLVAGSTAVVIIVIKNYFKNKKTQSKK